MPTLLKKLTPELKDAIGKTSGLAARYDVLLEKGKSESLRDDKDTAKYIDDVVKRYKSIKATSPSIPDLQTKKESYLAQLKQHAAEISVISFSKPGDVASRLKEVDFESDSIDKITKGMEQAGGNDDDLACLITSAVTSQISLEICNSDNHHHHHHSHHHSHW